MENLSLGNTAEMLTMNMQAINANKTFATMLAYIGSCNEVKTMSDELLIDLNKDILALVTEVEVCHVESLKMAVGGMNALEFARVSRDFFVKQLDDIKKLYGKYEITLPN